MQRCPAEDNLDMVSASVHVSALLGGGVCPVAGRHSFLYESHIPPCWRSHSRYGCGEHIPPPPPPFSSVQCCHWRGTLHVRVAIYTAAHTGSRVLYLRMHGVDWSRVGESFVWLFSSIMSVIWMNNVNLWITMILTIAIVTANCQSLLPTPPSIPTSLLLGQTWHKIGTAHCRTVAWR